MDLRRFIEEKLVRNDEICHFLSRTRQWYQYQKLVPVPIVQRRSGIGTNQSGTGTDASSSPDLCTVALLSPIFVY